MIRYFRIHFESHYDFELLNLPFFISIQLAEVSTRINKNDDVSYLCLVSNLKGHQQWFVFHFHSIYIQITVEQIFLNQFPGTKVFFCLSFSISSLLYFFSFCASQVTESLLEMGCYEVSLADTICIGTTGKYILFLLFNLLWENTKLGTNIHNRNNIRL